MPLRAYFRNVGAVLLALLFLADFYFPASPAVERPEVYPPVIRIHSERKWPERVVFDTTQPPIVVAGPAIATIEVAALTNERELPVVQAEKPAIRDALALLQPVQARKPDAAVQRVRQRKPHYRVARTNRHPGPRMMIAAQQRQFAWFGFPQWR